MSNKNKSNPKELGGALFSVPREVLHLSGMTLVRLMVYEAIYQFWLHNEDAWLSNKNIIERTSISSRGNLNKILLYLEKNNLIIREELATGRVFKNPKTCNPTGLPVVQKLPIGNPTGLPPVIPQDYRRNPTGCPNINEKIKIKDEVCVGAPAPQSHTHFLTEKNQNIFKEKFKGYRVTIEDLIKGFLDYNVGKPVTEKKFADWIVRERLDNYKKIQVSQYAPVNMDEIERRSIAKVKITNPNATVVDARAAAAAFKLKRIK